MNRCIRNQNRRYRAVWACSAVVLSLFAVPAFADDSTTMDIYGHAMLDTGFDFKQINPDWYDVMRPTKLPAYEDEFGDDGSYFMGVRQTRFGVKTSTPTAMGPLKTIFEFELFGVGSNAGQTAFRLRHAWGELGQVGAGQTWSVFMDPDVFPNSLEYWGPNGMVFYRNIQVRWTPWSTASGSRFALSLEQPGGSGDGERFADRVELAGVSGDFELPDLAAHVRLQEDWGHVQVAGIIRQIKWTDSGTDPIDLSGDELGWGLNVSTNINLGRHVFRGSVVYGEGMENYMNDATTDIAVLESTTPGSDPFIGKAIPMLGVVAFLDLNWSEKWTSTIGYSFLDLDLYSGQAPEAFQKGQYALTNILWHPVPNVMMGPEIQWGKRENHSDGFTSDDFKLQFSFKYSFGKTFSGI